MKPEEVEVVLVEDNPDDAYFTKRAFREANENIHIIHLTNGEAAINFFFNEEKFDNEKFSQKSHLILLDLHLPMVDGLEILRRLKADKDARRIPVVILSSADDDPTMKAGLELGAANYILKPVTYEGFLRVVTELSSDWQ
jgi:two-component system response regulator